MATESNPVQPFLARYATARSGALVFPGRFDAQSDVWVLDGPDGPYPIVQLPSNFGDTIALTRVPAEHGYTGVDPTLLASTTTFTKVSAEGDDTDVSCTGLLEITTKTHAQAESEDVPFTVEALGPAAGERPTPVRAIQ